MEMMDIIKVSSKGQISIPTKIREELKISTGENLLIYTYGDAIMIKVLKMPSHEEFKQMMIDAQEWAKKSGLSEADVDDAIKSARKAQK